MSEFEQALKYARDVFINYPRRYQQLTDALVKIDRERQDLLHVIELGKLDAIAMIKVVKDLKKVSLERRKVKDELEILEEFKNIKPKEHDINSTLGKVRSIQERHKAREYRMRIRKDLQELIK